MVSIKMSVMRVRVIVSLRVRVRISFRVRFRVRLILD